MGQESANLRPNPRFPPVSAWKTELRQLAPEVYAWIQAGGPGLNNTGVSNAGVIVGADHLMAIDALGAPLHTKAFIEAARKANGGKPFRRLLNTHHHNDHTAGNQFFLPAEIVGHPFCRQYLADTIRGPKPNYWERRDGWADGTEPWQRTPPNVAVTGNLTYYYGDTVVEVMFVGPAHTWGDLMVYLPKWKILFTGDVAFFYVAPTTWQGQVTKLLEVLDRIDGMDVETIVPGHGPIGGKRDLGELREYVRLLVTETRKRYAAGMRPGQAAADIDMGKFDNWVDAQRKVTDIVRLYAEFNGTLTPVNDAEGTRRANEEYRSLMNTRRL